MITSWVEVWMSSLVAFVSIFQRISQFKSKTYTVWDSSYGWAKFRANKIKISLLFAFAFFSACVDQEVRLTRDQLNLVDSLFLAERKIWVAQLEDSCDLMRSIYFNTWVDSMKMERLRDIEKMLAK